MLRFAVLVLFLAIVRSNDVTVTETSQCGKAAKVESYLETAADMISKAKENFLTGSGDDCSCPRQPMDCEEIMKCGQNKSGVYQVWPRNRIMSGSIEVFCDMDTDGGAWTVIQRRGDYKRPADFFFKSWHKYKTGFGDLRRDFWLGNDNIYALTNQKKYYLRFDLTDFDNNTRYAFYDQFWIDNEGQSYRLHVYDFSGDAGDSFHRSNDDHKFSTMDRDNDNSTENCAEKHKGGWWYSACGSSNLNGVYVPDKNTKSSVGIIWSTWKGLQGSLKMTEIKIRPFDFKTSLLDMDVDPK